MCVYLCVCIGAVRTFAACWDDRLTFGVIRPDLVSYGLMSVCHTASFGVIRPHLVS